MLWISRSDYAALENAARSAIRNAKTERGLTIAFDGGDIEWLLLGMLSSATKGPVLCEGDRLVTMTSDGLASWPPVVKGV